MFPSKLWQQMRRCSRFLTAMNCFAVLVELTRELIEHMDDGLVVSEQTMATNEALQPFFNSDELFRRIGGIDSLVAWLRRKEGQVRLGHVVLAGQQAYHESTGNGMGNPW
ncbi:pdcB [Escherichia coli]|nr:pdcB [Escherichia coli]